MRPVIRAAMLCVIAVWVIPRAPAATDASFFGVPAAPGNGALRDHTQNRDREPAARSASMPIAALATARVPMPLGLMWPIFPDGVLPTIDEVEIGRALFFEPAVSADATVSCASCHAPEAAMADPRRVSAGVGGRLGRRNSPTVWNAAYFETFGWTGDADSLEAQAAKALLNPEEIGSSEARIQRGLEPRYGADLRRLYGELSVRSVSRALAAYQRTLLSGDAPFDRYIYGGDRAAVSDAAVRGFTVFLGRARCVQCHFMRSPASHPFGGTTALYMDNRFHNIGVGFDKPARERDPGRIEVTRRPEDQGAFKTPTLRNVAETAPYMHDGSLKTLEEVVDHYDKGGNANPNLDPDIKRLELTAQEKQDLVAFMKSLTSHALSTPASRATPARP